MATGSKEAKKETAEVIETLTDGHEEELLNRIRIAEAGEANYEVWLSNEIEKAIKHGYDLDDLHVLIEHKAKPKHRGEITITTKATLTLEDENGEVEALEHTRVDYYTHEEQRKQYNENLHGLIIQIDNLRASAIEAEEEAEEELRELQQQRQAEWDRATDEINDKEQEIGGWGMVQENAGAATIQETAKAWLKT